LASPVETVKTSKAMVAAFSDAALKSMSPETVRGTLVLLRDDIGAAYLQMAQLLDKVLADALYLRYGFDSFEDYCEEELGFKRRKGMYLVSIYRTLVQGGVLSVAELDQIAWTKARLIAQLAKNNLLTSSQKTGEWVERAKTESYKELEASVKAELSSAPPSPSGASPLSSGLDEPVTVVRFGLYPPQLANYKEALERAKDLAASDKVGHLVDCICLPFNSEAWDSKKHALSKVCEHVERVFGIRLIAVDHNKAIVHGDDVVEAVLGGD